MESQMESTQSSMTDQAPSSARLDAHAGSLLAANVRVRTGTGGPGTGTTVRVHVRLPGLWEEERPMNRV